MEDYIKGIDSDRVGRGLRFLLAQFKDTVPEGTMLEFEFYVEIVGKIKFSMPMPDAATLPSPETVFENS